MMAVLYVGLGALVGGAIGVGALWLIRLSDRAHAIDERDFELATAFRDLAFDVIKRHHVLVYAVRNSDQMMTFARSRGIEYRLDVPTDDDMQATADRWRALSRRGGFMP